MGWSITFSAFADFSSLNSTEIYIFRAQFIKNNINLLNVPSVLIYLATAVNTKKELKEAIVPATEVTNNQHYLAN